MASISTQNPNRLAYNVSSSPLASLDTNQFYQSTFSYPSDIQNLAHAMLFNINVYDNAADFSANGSTGVTKASGNLQSVSQQLVNKTASPNASNTTLNVIGNNISSPLALAKTSRISTTIALYVPETVIYDSHQEYSSTSMTRALGGFLGTSLVGEGAKAIDQLFDQGLKGIGGVASSLWADIKKTATSQGAASLGASVNAPGSILTATTGYALNPLLEVIYASPTLRTFSFDFVFAPKNSNEADNIWNIIQQFRRFHVPSLPQQTSGISGMFLVPPAQFDIAFLRQDPASGSFVVNTNIPGIMTCVLTDINVNYTPENQWTTFYDGFPTHIMLRLGFTETIVQTQDHIDKGY